MNSVIEGYFESSETKLFFENKGHSFSSISQMKPIITRSQYRTDVFSPYYHESIMPKQIIVFLIFLNQIRRAYVDEYLK